MKTLIGTMMIAGVLSMGAALAQPPAEPEDELEGSELTKFYLQQILDQAEQEPAVEDNRNFLQELKDLVGRLERRQSEQLAKQTQEAEHRARTQTPPEPGITIETDATEPAADARVALRPVIDTEAPAPPSPSVPAEPVVKPHVIHDPAVAPASAELPPAIQGYPAGDDGDRGAQIDTYRTRINQTRRVVARLIEYLEELKTHLDAIGLDPSQSTSSAGEN